MYKGCIIDQSNWSEPFCPVVMMPDLESSNLGSRPGWGTQKVFIYRSIYPLTIIVDQTSYRTNGLIQSNVVSTGLAHLGKSR